MLTLEKQAEIVESNKLLRSGIAARDKEVLNLKGEIRYLQRQIEALKRKLFGSPACERVSAEQLTLALAELEKELSEQSESEREILAYSRRPARPAEAAARLPGDIETETVEIIPDEVKADPGAYERIGEVATKELDVVPMRFVLKVTIRPKFKAKGVLDAVPFLAPLPPRAVPGGAPAAGLVACLIVWKYADHLPLHRLEGIFRERFGVRIPRQRMCDWIGYAVENWLSIIYRSIRNGLLGGSYLQIDETPIRYLDTDRGGSRNGFLWVFGCPEDDICFDWNLGRGKEAADAIVAGFEGILQSDGYVVYDSCCSGRPIVQLGCWAHARRKFYEAYKAGELEAARYLLPIRKLYEIERELPERADGRREIRQERSVPILAEIKSLLDAEADKYLAKSAMSQAVGYALSQWAKLAAYCDHGRARIDNNLTEQAIRPCKLGAKNWLFIGSPEAGHKSAKIYTILESCRRHGVEPMAYLKDVLERLPTMTNREAEELTPKKWKQAQVKTR